MAIALFDLDKTLLARNSAALWLMWELRRGHVRLHQAALATAWLLRYRMGHTDLEAPLKRSVGVLQGVPDALWRSRTQAFYNAWVRSQYRRGGLLALARHRLAGDRLVLLSSTHHYLAEAVHRDLGFDDVLCTRLEVDPNGTLTGRIAGELCFGPGKLAATRALCARLGASLDACVFYTDSNSDTPVLEAVGRPVAVNPDPALARRARRAGWPIEDWGPAVPWPPGGLQVACYGALTNSTPPLRASARLNEPLRYHRFSSQAQPLTRDEAPRDDDRPL